MRRESIRDTNHKRFLYFDDLDDNLPLLVLDGGVFR